MKVSRTCEYASSCFECPLPDCIVTRAYLPNLNMTDYDMEEVCKKRTFRGKKKEEKSK